MRPVSRIFNVSVADEEGAPGLLDFFVAAQGDIDASAKRRAPGEALGQAVLFLERGENDKALQAASDACHEAPESPEPHYAFGQAWMRQGNHRNAERAFATALRLAPAWADAWVNYGLARHRQGALEDAVTAMRQALHHAPGHLAARANLGGFLALGHEPEEGAALLSAVLDKDPANAGARFNLAALLVRSGRASQALALLDAAPDTVRTVEAWDQAYNGVVAALQRGGEAVRANYVPSPPDALGNHVLDIRDPLRALGLSVGYLMGKPAFAKLPFGDWSETLSGQVQRGHVRFFAGQDGAVVGFFGWALAPEELCRDWMAGRRALKTEDCVAGDCVIFNAWAADTAAVHRFMVGESRRLFADKRAGFYKRFYPDGRVRLARLPGNAFVDGHISRSAGA